MAVDLIVDAKSIKSVEIALESIPKDMPKATASALNRTVDYTATQIKNEVRKSYSIRAKDIYSTLKKHKASSSRLSASVESTGRTLTLYNHFRVSPKQPKPGGKYKVKVAIKKGRMQPISSTPKPFVASAKNSTQVFRRTGKSRTPVVVLRSLSVPQMISNEETQMRIQKLSNDMLERRIEHEINRRLDKLGGAK